MKFTPLKNFKDEDLRSEYVRGLTYTVRPGNEVLAAKVQAWLLEGKVAIGEAPSQPANPARIKGKAKVK